jgi:hypothetical protein
MAGLVPAIHALLVATLEGVDARDKRGHDAEIDESEALIVAAVLIRGSACSTL